MISIYEAVGTNYFIASILGSCVCIYLLYQIRYIKSFFDPSVLTFFQLIFTFFILLFFGLASLNVWICYLVFFITIVITRNVSLFKGTFFSESEWFILMKFFLVISIIANIILLSKKGFILFHPDPRVAKVEFYKGYGLFKRINEIGAPLFGIAAFYLFKQKRQILAGFLLCYTAFLLFSSGSKSGLISMILFLGAYYHFFEIKFNKKRVILLLIVALLSVLGLFYWIYQDKYLDGFYNRIVAYADGPFYFFNGNMEKALTYPPDYPLDQLMVNLRLRPELKYRSLGPAINKFYFHHTDELTGPNPQFSVESIAVFQSLYFLYPCILGFLFSLARKTSSTPFAFIFLSLFFNPLPLDSQYAFSNVLTLALAFVMLLGIKHLRSYQLQQPTLANE
jgi:hypothetical protein